MSRTRVVAVETAHLDLLLCMEFLQRLKSNFGRFAIALQRFHAHFTQPFVVVDIDKDVVGSVDQAGDLVGSAGDGQRSEIGFDDKLLAVLDVLEKWDEDLSRSTA